MSMRFSIRSIFITLCICSASYSLIAAYAHFWLIEPKIKLGQVIKFNNPNDKFTNEILSQGWATPESWGVWSNSEKAILIFPKPSSTASEIIIRVRAFINFKLPVQHIDLTINKQPTIKVALSKANENIINLPLDPNYREDSLIQVHIILNNAASPKGLDLGDDSRTIAIGIESIEFK